MALGKRTEEQKKLREGVTLSGLMEELGRGRGSVWLRVGVEASQVKGGKSTEPVCSAAESCRASHVWVEVTSGEQLAAGGGPREGLESSDKFSLNSTTLKTLRPHSTERDPILHRNPCLNITKISLNT